MLTVGVVPKSTRNPYFEDCRLGAQEAAEELGFALSWDEARDFTVVHATPEAIWHALSFEVGRVLRGHGSFAAITSTTLRPEPEGVVGRVQDARSTPTSRRSSGSALPPFRVPRRP
jgi:hypothetical protein